MYESIKFNFKYNEQHTPSDSSSYEIVLSSNTDSYIEDIEYYTIATATSSASQESLLLLDIRNILVIGFILLFILIIYYHVKSSIISYLN